MSFMRSGTELSLFLRIFRSTLGASEYQIHRVLSRIRMEAGTEIKSLNRTGYSNVHLAIDNTGNNYAQMMCFGKVQSIS